MSNLTKVRASSKCWVNTFWQVSKFHYRCRDADRLYRPDRRAERMFATVTGWFGYSISFQGILGTSSIRLHG